MTTYEQGDLVGLASFALILLTVMGVVSWLRRDQEYRDRWRAAVDRNPAKAIPAQIDFHKRYAGVHLRVLALILPLWFFYLFVLQGVTSLIFGVSGPEQ